MCVSVCVCMCVSVCVCVCVCINGGGGDIEQTPLRNYGGPVGLKVIAMSV